MKEQDISKLKGIGPKTKKIFEKLGIYKIEDLISHYPLRYIKFEKERYISQCKLENDKQAIICGQIIKPFLNKFTKKLKITSTILMDSTDNIEVEWYNSTYISNSLKLYEKYIFVGNIVNKRGVFILEHPKVYIIKDYYKIINTLQAIYPLTKGISNNMLSKNINIAIDSLEEDDVYEYLPAYIIKKYNLFSYKKAIKAIHFPESYEEIEKARERIVFDELFQFLYNIKLLRDEHIRLKSKYLIKFTDSEYKELENILGFKLSESQKSVINTLLFDMNSGNVMNRLIQGDVGCGKTIISVFAMYACYKNNYQSLIMVPTEVLARQHYENLNKLFSRLEKPPRLALLTGSMTKKQHLDVYKGLETAQIDIVIGTHALITKESKYKNLALVIIDEQHRFGVKQRQDLSLKGDYPHVIVMSATPIPRTLGIIIYGDMDISIVDTKPVGRIPIKNAIIKKDDRFKAYKHILKELEKGHQAYVICSMVEESENIKACDVISYTDILRTYFPDKYKIEFLHGKLKDKRKNEIMQEFSEGRIDILVSTTVIEVGVDVKNASVILIEDAQRFGLAALHQLRGRVGRSNIQAYCIFVLTSDSDNAKKRLDIVGNSNDGFYIANEDMKLRGAGELFGMAQSGEFDFGLADIYNDSKMLINISEELKKFHLNDDEKILFEKKLIEYNYKSYKKLTL